MIPPPLWQLLREVRRLRVQVHADSPDPARDRRERHRGSGVIEVEEGAASVLWRERGQWETGRLAGLSFRNVTRWTRSAESGALEVAHGRRVRTVFLAAFQEERPGLLVAVAPHLCGGDSYSAALHWREDRLVLVWSVSGRRQSYRLAVTAWPVARRRRGSSG